MNDSSDLQWLMEPQRNPTDDTDHLMEWDRGELVELIWEMRDYVWMYRDLCQ